ncbi:MAG: hemerythrin domain-containing protein, partial [Alphaproteobacteria bacterium]|nr:hemerythrin domain-containing protein [Alphaproteobacteria bacterium]
MMDVAQLFKRDHARTNELFDKLSDTSDQAVKSRERLFGQLKTEIEAHAKVVEDQLYPILKKHRETKDLVPSVKERNEVEKRLAELDQMPKEDEGFLKKVGELKKTVEQHLRDEERRMVPAIKKALEDDEFKELATSLNEGKREQIQEAKQRAEGAGAASGGAQSAQAFGTSARAASEGGRRVVEEVIETTRRGVEALSDRSNRIAGEFGSQLERTRHGAIEAAEIYTATAHATAERMKVLTEASRATASGVQEIRQAWVDWVNDALQTNGRAAQQLFQCRSLRE